MCSKMILFILTELYIVKVWISFYTEIHCIRLFTFYMQVKTYNI